MNITDLGEQTQLRPHPTVVRPSVKRSYFVLSVLGFSFWYFLAVPFASHRETYWWLGMVNSYPFTEAFALIASTYRPLAQTVSWTGFVILDPAIFPTSVLRQSLLQGIVYTFFVLAWWLIFRAVVERRLFATIAFVAGGVFFSGYVHLFHIYGLSYVPVILMLGTLLNFHLSGTFEKRELSVATVAIMLSLWHPYATALFVGYYGGFYLDTFSRRSKAQHVRSLAILLIALLAILVLVVLFPRNDTKALDNRLAGFLVSYQTNEVNVIASAFAFLLAQVTVASMALPHKLKWAGSLVVCGLGPVLLLMGLPVLFLWLMAVLVKLFLRQEWSLFFLALTATVLPMGGGIGTPIYGLFAIVIATWATSAGWVTAENALAFLAPKHVLVALAASAIVIVAVRSGVTLPLVANGARPLLEEREKTYQLENALAWLHNSEYCGCEISFATGSGNPVDSLDNVIMRRNRPPAAIEDVRLFWDKALRCGKSKTFEKRQAVVTFGGPVIPDSNAVLTIAGRHAGDAKVWITSSGE
jgi:hypothetical protein